MGKYRMYEPWGYVDENDYISKKSQIDSELEASKENDKKEFSSVDYDSEDKSLVFKNVDGEEVSKVSLEDIIPEKVVESAEYDSETKTLIIHFTNGDTVDIPLDDLVDVFSAGDGLQEQDGTISVKMAEDSEGFLSVGSEGIKLSGVQDAIDGSLVDFENEIQAVSGKTEEIEASLEGYATKDEIADFIKEDELESYATKDELSAATDDMASKTWVGEQGFLTNGDLDGYAKEEDIPTSNSALTNDAGYITDAALSDYATKDEVATATNDMATQTWVNEQGFLKEHQDISQLATKSEVESANTELLEALNLEQSARTQSDEEISSAITDIIETKQDKGDYILKEDYDAMVEEKNAEISALNASVYSLKKIVGDIGGAVTYELPGEGKSFNTLMSNNGTVKLTEDVVTSRFGPGITASNHVKLNLNTHDLTITGLTISSAQAAIMARGTQEITVYGKGTVDSGEGICIEGNGASSVINLTGSTTTYRTNRSGGELVYCYSGTINIVNGTFRNDGDDKKFLLNCYDANYRNGTAKIIVTGGKFYDFNPGDNTAEGPNTSFVAEGYHVEVSTVIEDEVEHTIYTVKKDA